MKLDIYIYTKPVKVPRNLYYNLVIDYPAYV